LDHLTPLQNSLLKSLLDLVVAVAWVCWQRLKEWQDGVLSLLVKGGWDAAVAVASKVKLFRNATSFGGCESLIEHRASAESPASQSPRNLLRLSVGLEHPDDLIEDLRQALA